MKRNALIGALGGAAALATAGFTHAGEVSESYSWDNGTQAASATFVFNDDGATTTLDIMLENTMSVTGNFSPQWLQGLFFDIVGSPTLTYTGLGGDGSDDYNDMIIMHQGADSDSPDSYSAYTDVTVDHFWGLRQDISGGELPFGSQQYGLAAAGLGVFGNSSVLNLQAGGPLPQLDGSDGGILSGALLDAGTLNIPGGHTEREMVDGGIWLTFDLGDYDILQAQTLVSNVFFQFGTSFGEVIPVPLALPLGLAGLAGVIAGRRRLGRKLAI